MSESGDQPRPGSDPGWLHKSRRPGEPEPPLDFDPYRFGAPEHPVPPEYAPPGYRPPQQHQPPRYPPSPHWSGGYGPPSPPPYSREYPQPRTGNGKAIAALVLGIVSIGLCWLSLLDVVPVVLAVVFGILARGDARRQPQRAGRGMATAGIACAVIGALLAALFTAWVFSRFRPCLQYQVGSAQYQTCVSNRL